MARGNMKRIIYLCAMLLMTLTACTGVPENVSPVNNFDAEKYAGQWYEIARFDHRFEDGLSNVTATHTHGRTDHWTNGHSIIRRR